MLRYRGSRLRQFAAPYNRPRCSSTGGGFLLFGIMLDICKAASIFEIILGIHYAFNEPVMSFFLNKRFKIIYAAYIINPFGNFILYLLGPKYAEIISAQIYTVNR